MCPITITHNITKIIYVGKRTYRVVYVSAYADSGWSTYIVHCVNTDDAVHRKVQCTHCTYMFIRYVFYVTLPIFVYYGKVFFCSIRYVVNTAYVNKGTYINTLRYTFYGTYVIAYGKSYTRLQRKGVTRVLDFTGLHARCMHGHITGKLCLLSLHVMYTLYVLYVTPSRGKRSKYVHTHSMDLYIRYVCNNRTCYYVFHMGNMPCIIRTRYFN